MEDLDQLVERAPPARSSIFFSSRRRHTRWNCDWSSDVCSSDLAGQISIDPVTSASKALDIWASRGAHVSIAPIIEMQMRHGMPATQLCLDHGILPSLSPDVETNMTTDPFSLMRGIFCQQRALANDLVFPISNPNHLPIPQLVTCRQVIEMCTIAGAA